MRNFPSKFWFCVLGVLLLAACSGPEPAKESAAAPAKPVPPPVPAEVQAAAEAALGAEVEVLLHGDLALAGDLQVLAINRLKSTPTGAVPGILFTRAVIVAKDGEKWKEVFRCDEHLKNPKGFMGGTPLSPISGWRLQHEQSKDKGLAMYFTPIQQPASGKVAPIGVRWNPRSKRYQSLDRNYENFLGEVGSLEKPESVLR